MTSVVFSGLVASRVTYDDREPATTSLRVAIERRAVAERAAPVLDVRVTDESDPLFFYSMELTEEDFHVLKAQQGLLVDFATFPSKIVQLLSQVARGDAADRFGVVLATGGKAPSWSVVEENDFKQLVHLSLAVRKGSDAEVKAYLSGVVSNFRARVAELEARLADVEVRSEAERERDGKELQELRTLRETSSTRAAQELHAARMDHAGQMTALKEAHMVAMKEAQARFEAERDALAAEKDAALVATQSRLDAALAEVRELQTRKYALESSEQEVTHRAQSTETELRATRADLEQVKAALRESDQARVELERARTEHRIRIAALEQNVADKEEMGARMSELVETARSQKAQLEESVAMLKEKIARAEDKKRRLGEEVQKGNSVLERMAAEVRAAREKLKVKNTVIQRQEELVHEHEERLVLARRVEDDLRTALGKKEDETAQLGHAARETELKMKEMRAELESNEQLIAFLNARATNGATSGMLNSSGNASGASVYKHRMSYFEQSTAGRRSAYLDMSKEEDAAAKPADKAVSPPTKGSNDSSSMAIKYLTPSALQPVV